MNTVFALPLVLLTFVSTHTRCLLRGREVWVCPGFGVGVSRMWCGLPTPYLPVRRMGLVVMLAASTRILF